MLLKENIYISGKNLVFWVENIGILDENKNIS
jgi:hypothetical protein